MTTGINHMTNDHPGKNRKTSAMVMAAGLGTRMRPLTDTRPKPMVALNGIPLIDYTLQRLADHSISPIVANVHYLPEVLESHLETSLIADVIIADERAELLDTGGGAYANLDILGPEPFFILNSDSLWIEDGIDNLQALLEAWDDEAMDCLMLLAPTKGSLGYSGNGDFTMNADGCLFRQITGEQAAHVHTGCCLIHPRLFDNAPRGPFSLNILWDEALANHRLFGVALNGLWLHIGTPEALAAAEEKLQILKTP